MFDYGSVLVWSPSSNGYPAAEDEALLHRLAESVHNFTDFAFGLRFRNDQFLLPFVSLAGHFGMQQIFYKSLQWEQFLDEVRKIVNA